MSQKNFNLTTTDKLRHLIREKHGTITAAAEALNLSRVTLNGIVCGNAPTSTVAELLQSEFGIPVKDWPMLRR